MVVPCLLMGLFFLVFPFHLSLISICFVRNVPFFPHDLLYTPESIVTLSARHRVNIHLLHLVRVSQSDICLIHVALTLSFANATL